ncbi:MAG: pitrilysin family protein, partial [Pseudomonadota bacterium]
MTEIVNFRSSTLDNGVRVVSERLPHVRTASVGIWVNAGARHEVQSNNGVAHMLEHMAFKGTKRRNARRIAEEIEDVGGNLNAYTSREHTAYYARVLSKDVALAGDILADILQNSTFDETELARERGVILQEIGQVQDTPDDLIFDLFQECAYSDQSIGRSVLGPPEIVAAMPRETLVSFMDYCYFPSNLVVAGAGEVDHDVLVELASSFLGDLNDRPESGSDIAQYTGGVKLESRDLDQVHIILGVETVSLHDEDYFALQLFSTMLGGGMSSRLFQEVREER